MWPEDREAYMYNESIAIFLRGRMCNLHEDEARMCFQLVYRQDFWDGMVLASFCNRRKSGQGVSTWIMVFPLNKF